MIPPPQTHPPTSTLPRPRSKFHGSGQGATDVWVWNATRGGQYVALDSCCLPQARLVEGGAGAGGCRTASAPLYLRATHSPHSRRPSAPQGFDHAQCQCAPRADGCIP